MPKLSESNERVVEFILHSTLYSLFDIMQSVDKESSELTMYMALVAVETSQKLFCFQESIWGELSDSRQMDWVQQLSKNTTRLATVYLRKSDIWLLISRILQILMTRDGFRVLLLLPDTMISLLQLAIDRMSVISARFERQTW